MRLQASAEEVGSAFNMCLTYQSSSEGVLFHPYEIELYRFGKQQFLDQLSQELKTAYVPDNAPIIGLPKGNGAVRPVHRLSMRDQIVYTLLGVKIVALIRDDLGASHGSVDFAHAIRYPIVPDRWFEYYYHPWRGFVRTSIALAKDYEFVVETDIAGFYENIDTYSLISELKRIGVSSETTTFLRGLLQKWRLPTRGIPQCHPTSDLLSKLYLGSIDAELSNRGFLHKRYSDDIRLFSKSRSGAKRSLVFLQSLLREKGLILQSGKTKLYDDFSAVKIFSGVQPFIDEIADKLDANPKTLRAVETLVFNSHYMSVRDVMRESSESALVSAPVLREAYDIHILRAKTATLNKTLFHFILGQLAKRNDSHAIKDCLKRFVDYPQETKNILQYLSNFKLSLEEQEQIFDFLEHDENVYEFQSYLLLAFLATRATDRIRLCSLARSYAFGNTATSFLKAQARAVLEKHGSNADFEAIHRDSVLANSEIEKAEIICCLQNMEQSRRNAFYASFGSDSLLTRVAVSFAKRGRDKRVIVSDDTELN